MIQQYFKFQATQEEVLQELLAFDVMPQWWPGLDSAHVVIGDSRMNIVDAVFKIVTTIKMRVEFLHKEDHVVTFRQIDGWFKRYEGDWTLLHSPDGVGTTLRITMHYQAGSMVPKSMIHAKLSENLTQFGAALGLRLSEKQPVASLRPAQGGVLRQNLDVDRAKAQRPMLARKPIHIFQTAKGIELWLEGKRYIMKSMR
jgi:hypothetical protein